MFSKLTTHTAGVIFTRKEEVEVPAFLRFTATLPTAMSTDRSRDETVRQIRRNGTTANGKTACDAVCLQARRWPAHIWPVLRRRVLGQENSESGELPLPLEIVRACIDAVRPQTFPLQSWVSSR